MEKNERKANRKHGLTALVLLLLAVGGIATLLYLQTVPVKAGPEERDSEETAVIVVEEETPAARIPNYDPSMSGEEGWVQADGKLFYLRGGGAVTGLRLIDGRYYYFDQNGVKAASVGVDVSTYNENIDWERVKAQGIDFAIIRVGGRGWTSGKIYGDLRCEGYLRGARKAGVKIGVYFYSTAVDEHEAAAEADAVLQVLHGRKLELPVFYDVELSGEFPHGRADRLAASRRTRLAQVFCERIESAGYEAGVYAGQYFYMASLNYQPLSRYTVWMANYTQDLERPSFRGRYQLWQFTDRGNVDGIRCGVDMNILFSENLPEKSR